MGALYVKAVGLASPLGGAVQAAAAFRAGLARPGPAPDLEVMFPGDEEPQAVTVHALPSATFGFSGAGRLVALLAEALVDLGASVDLTQLGPDTGLFLALPDPDQRGFELAQDPEDEDPEEPGARISALGSKVAALAGAPARIDLRRLEPRFYGGGHTAFASALRGAQRAVASGEIRSALVAAVDSLASAEAVELFAAQGRIKNSGQPMGFAPGEAAAAILLAPRADLGDADSAILAGDPVFEQERIPSGERPSDGRALASCLVQAVGPIKPGASAPVLVSDHDGETRRAHELGMMQQRLVALRNRELADAPIWFPATGLGNTGVASGAVALVLAFRALIRGYAKASTLAVLSSDEGGARAAFSIAAASASGGRPAPSGGGASR